MLDSSAMDTSPVGALVSSNTSIAFPPIPGYISLFRFPNLSSDTTAYHTFLSKSDSIGTLLKNVLGDCVVSTIGPYNSSQPSSSSVEEEMFPPSNGSPIFL